MRELVTVSYSFICLSYTLEMGRGEICQKKIIPTECDHTSLPFRYVIKS